MADDVRAGLLVVYPSAPHDLVGEEGILWQSHGIYDAAGAVVRLATVVGVGIGEDNLHATAADAGSCARALQPVVIPAAHHLNGKLVHVVIILVGGLAAIERAVAILVEGVAVGIPVLAQSLVAAVLHGPHGVLLALVDIEHLATVFRLVDVQHFAAADGPSAVGVVLVTNLLEFQHVFA